MLSNHDALNKFYLNLQQNLQFKFSKNCNIKYGLDQNIFKFSSYDNLPCIIFNPIKNKSSLLAIEDAINKRLSKIILHTIITKTSNQVLSDKIDHIFTIAGINFASNIITFTLNIDYSKSIAKIDCKYPLYDYLNKSSGNIFCGISLTESEIKHIINVYKEKIIEPIKNNLENINISANSDKAVKFYVLIKFYIEFINAIDDSLNNMFKKYEINQNIINNLNTFIDAYQISEEQQKLDREIYENEIKIRQKYKPDWFMSQGQIMKKDLTTTKKKVTTNSKTKELADKVKDENKTYRQRIDTFLNNENVNKFIENYEIEKNNQKWADIVYWQNLVLDILNSNGGRLWFDTRIKKYCFRSKLNGDIAKENQEVIATLLTSALLEPKS